MKKLLFIVGIFFAVGLMFRNVDAGDSLTGGLTRGTDARYYMYLESTSGTIINGSGVLYAVNLSSGKDNTFPWVQFFSTTSAGVEKAKQTYEAFSKETKITVPLLFLSSPTIVGGNSLSVNKNQRIEFGGGHGLRFGTTLQYIKSDDVSGSANTFVVEYGY